LEIFSFNLNSLRTQLLWAVAVATLTALTIMTAAADDNPAETEKDKIHITADTLISETESKYAEFSGNVRAIQGETVIRADSLKIFYRQGQKNKKNPTAAGAAIEKIVATGNVKITLDDKVALTQQAVYLTATRVLMLTGPNSKVTSGKDSVSGQKITFFRAEGRIKVESGPDQRVEAVFSSGGKGLK
jgi:lipopolysaccharide export system protein LptA